MTVFRHFPDVGPVTSGIIALVWLLATAASWIRFYRGRKYGPHEDQEAAAKMASYGALAVGFYIVAAVGIITAYPADVQQLSIGVLGLCLYLIIKRGKNE